MCFFLSRYCCLDSSCCMVSAKESEFPLVFLKRCHCAPSMRRGPDFSIIVATPCVVLAWTGPIELFHVSGCSKTLTAPVDGGFCISLKMFSSSRLRSFRVSGSLDACGTGNLSLSVYLVSSLVLLASGSVSPQVSRMCCILARMSSCGVM